MMRIPLFSRLPGILLALMACFDSAPAQAVNIQSLFGDLCDYYVLDSDTCAAKTLIDCLVKTGGNSDAMLKCAGDYDPKSKKFIDIYFAAKKPDYVKFIELAGPVVACQGASAFLPPGPPKDILCGELMQPIAKLGFTTAAQFYQAAVDNNWAKLLYLAGPGLGCKALDLLGGVPGQELLCGTVAKIIEEGVDLAKKGLSTGKDLLEGGAEVLSEGAEALGDLVGLGGGSGKPPMSEQAYYEKIVHPWLHERVLNRLAHGQQALGLSQAQMQKCLAYYPELIYQGRCESLSKRLHTDADAFAQVVATAPAAHFATRLKPLVADLGAEQYWGGVEAYKQFVDVLPPKDWHPGSFWVGANKGIATLMLDCQKEMKDKFPVPLAPGVTGALTPPSFWNWVCYQSAGKQLGAALVAEKQRLDQQVKPKVAAAGCQAQKAASASLYFKCGAYPAYDSCQQAFNGYRYSHCGVDKESAEKGLAQKIAQLLGAKRCAYVEKTGLGLSPAVRCTRPYKQEACKLMVAQHKSASAGAVGTHVQCTLQEDEAFLNSLKKAKAMVAKLNGGATVSGVIGTKEGLGDAKAKSSSAGSCKQTWDPLSITCTSQQILSLHPEINLPGCQPDPNRDGADAPCYSGPLSAKMAQEAVGQTVVKGGPAESPLASSPAMRAGPPDAPPRSGRSALEPAREVAVEAGLRQAQPAAQPDLALGLPVLIGGRLVIPGGSIGFEGRELTAARAGGCEVTAEITVVNRGGGASEAFENAWKVGGMRAAASASAGIAPGGRDIQRVSLSVRPGMNLLELAIDSSDRVREADEANNQSRFMLNITGDCAAATSGRGMRAMPAAPVMAPAPVTPAAVPAPATLPALPGGLAVPMPSNTRTPPAPIQPAGTPRVAPAR
ncbi:MAG TPA: CARDB domain-containing protein [Thiobacillaceae bacterium]|nr:CARDB domain-containing protein [Thiobacillaceae bacterium]